MKSIFRFIIVICLVLIAYPSAAAKSKDQKSGEVKKSVRAAGSCAISGLKAEQAQLMALQRARAAAVKKALGVKTRPEIRTTSFEQSMADIEEFGSGFVVREKVNLLRPAGFKIESSAAPIPDHRVWIIADVYIPGAPSTPLGLKASLNRNSFKTGEKGELAIRTDKDAGIAVFLMRSDDKVSMVFPNIHEVNNIVVSGTDFVFPAKNSKMDLEMQTFAGRQKDMEALFVIAWDRSLKIKVMDLFPETDPLGFSEFFGKLSTIGNLIEMKVLPYIITDVNKGEK